MYRKHIGLFQNTFWILIYYKGKSNDLPFFLFHTNSKIVEQKKDTKCRVLWLMEYCVDIRRTPLLPHVHHVHKGCFVFGVVVDVQCVANVADLLFIKLLQKCVNWRDIDFASAKFVVHGNNDFGLDLVHVPLCADVVDCVGATNWDEEQVATGKGFGNSFVQTTDVAKVGNFEAIHQESEHQVFATELALLVVVEGFQAVDGNVVRCASANNVNFRWCANDTIQAIVVGMMVGYCYHVATHQRHL